MKRLYHYTSIERWQLISESGFINTTESNLHPRREHAGPDVVWLTTDPDLEHDHGLGGTVDGTDKTEVRITVELPNNRVHKWRDWAVERGIDKGWLAALSNAGGAGTWRVTENRITADRWVAVDCRERAALSLAAAE